MSESASNLFKVTLTYKTGGQVVFLYKGEGTARVALEQALNTIRDRHLFASVVNDDYGNELVLEHGVLASAMLTDIVLEAEANHTITLFNARAQIKLQKKAENDPELKAQAALVEARNRLNGGGAAFRQ